MTHHLISWSLCYNFLNGQEVPIPIGALVKIHPLAREDIYILLFTLQELHMKAYYLKINDEDRAIKTTTCDVKTTTGEYSCIQLSLDFR